MPLEFGLNRYAHAQCWPAALPPAPEPAPDRVPVVARLVIDPPMLLEAEETIPEVPRTVTILASPLLRSPRVVLTVPVSVLCADLLVILFVELLSNAPVLVTVPRNVVAAPPILKVCPSVLIVAVVVAMVPARLPTPSTRPSTSWVRVCSAALDSSIEYLLIAPRPRVPAMVRASRLTAVVLVIRPVVAFRRLAVRLTVPRSPLPVPEHPDPVPLYIIIVVCRLPEPT